MNKPQGYYESIPEMIPQSVAIIKGEIYKNHRSITGYKCYPLDRYGKASIYGKDLMMDDAIYLRQNNEFDFSNNKPITAEVFLCPITDKDGNFLEYRYKIHQVIR